jgi:hypothetical protein
MSPGYKLSKIAFALITLIISFIVLAFPPANLFSYDVFGYYMYLPLQFKYHDITIQNYSIITNIFDHYHASETFYQAIKWDNGNWVMRYPSGMAVLFSPFYFIADLIAPHTSYPADGFSKPYQISVLAGCLTYTITGLHFTRKILNRVFSDKASALTLVALALGTNYFFHVSVHGQGAMSHNILFTLYAIIFYLTMRWHEELKTKHIVLLGLTIGLATLCRASEMISLAIPFFYGVKNYPELKNKLKLLLTKRSQIILFGLCVFGVGMVQLSYYKFASGRFLINPYGSGNPGEGLELFRPHILKVLFSFRKGWYIYTPLMLFVTAGFYFLYKRKKELFYPVLIYSLINLYIVSSWSCWWFGSCFGNRALVASYAVLSLTLACFFEHILSLRIRFLCLIAMALFIFLNLFQSWQIHKGIMDSTNMSRAYYFSTFLQTTPPTEEQRRLLLQGKFSSGIDAFDTYDAQTHSLAYAEIKNYEKANSLMVTDSIHHSGKHALVTGEGFMVSDSLVRRHEDITGKSYTWIKATVWVYSHSPPAELDAYFEIHMTHKNWIFKPVKYKLDDSNFKPDTWNKLEYYYLTPDDLRNTKDKVCIYFFNKGDKLIYVDDLIMESYEPITDQSVF